MFEWWSQKIGSWAAVFGSAMRPAEPPTRPCTTLCGTFSSDPVNDRWAKWAGGDLEPPNPGSGGGVKLTNRSALLVSTAASGKRAPALIPAGLRPGSATKSGLTEPSGSCGSRKEGGSVVDGKPLE